MSGWSRYLCVMLAWWGLLPMLAAPGLLRTAAAQPPATPAQPTTTEPLPPEPTPEEVRESEQLPKLEEMELPDTQRLLAGPAIDWLVLRNGRVLEIEPVYPRPDTLAAVEVRVKAAAKALLGQKGQERLKAIKFRDRQSYLELTLLEGEDREFQVHVRFIQEIIYYEDLMLRRIDQLLDAGNTRDAVDLLIALEQRDPNWPSLRDRLERVQFLEGSQRLKEKDYAGGLVNFEQVFRSNPDYPELRIRLDFTFDKLIAQAHAEGDLRRSRYFLAQLHNLLPASPVDKRWTAQFDAAQRELLSAAVAAEGQGDLATALDKVELAARTWPVSEALTGIHRRIARKYPRLHVGVLDLPLESQPAGFATPAELRRRQLSEIPLFEPERIDGTIVRYNSDYFQECEPTELGRTVRMRLRSRWLTGSPGQTVTAGKIVAVLTQRLNPGDSHYDERFASYVRGMTLESPAEFSVNFRHAPLRPEAIFEFPLPHNRIVAGIASSAGAEIPAARWDAPQHYLLSSQDADQAVYQRSLSENPSAFNGPVEIVEHLYASAEKAVQGFQRGEVSFLPRVQSTDVARFEGLADVFVHEYAAPETHLLQFHPHSTALGSRALRRALIFALNRGAMLDETILRAPRGRLGRLTSAPFPTTSYAYDPLVEPQPFDPRLAVSLVLAARKELKAELPPLRLAYGGTDPAVLASIARMIRHWEQVGVPVRLLSDDELAQPPNGKVPAWDIRYRIVSLVEPLVEIWPALTLEGQARIESLAFMPDWLRQELVTLDQAGDWKSARQALHGLQKHLWAEAYLIPLWEVSRFMVIRKHVRGVPTRPLGEYQRIENWDIQPWFARDPL